MPTPTPPTTRPSLFLAAAVAALGGLAGLVMPSRALAVSGQHSSLASFNANVRATTIMEPFTGPDNGNVPSYAFSGNGYSAILAVDTPGFGLIRVTNRMGSANATAGARFTFTGRPVSAFAGDFVIVDGALTSLAGTISIVTDTGESFNVAIPVGGAFAGITASRPFTTLTFNTVPPGGTLFELIDTAYVGTSASAPELTDQCGDAETLSPITAAVYPFTTVGATAEASPGVCDGAVDTGPDVWLRYVAPVHGTVVFNTCGCNFDSILRVFASCTAATLGANIACNDDFCTDTGPNQGRASQVSFRVVAGEDYLIRISGFSGASGSGNLNFSFAPDCTADFNHSGGKEVQDIFDFLAAWFGAC